MRHNKLKNKIMNEYLVKWLSENFPGMVQNGDDCLCELDYHDMNRFADWMQEQLTPIAVGCCKEQFYCFREVSRNEKCDKPCFADGKCGWKEPQ